MSTSQTETQGRSRKHGRYKPDSKLEDRQFSFATRRDLVLLIALTFALHLPFIGQAFHLDDVQYLDIAQNVYQNPFFPLDLESAFEGHHVSLWAHSHPPLNSYIIAGLLLFHGRLPSEMFLHSAYLFFPILVAVSFYFLARQFVRHALLASALLVTNPTLIVCTHTLMADVPLLALWLCGTALFTQGVERNNDALLFGAAIPITAACFYAYQGFALIPLLGFYALSRKRLQGREALVLGLPILLMTGWQFSGYLHRGVTYASAMLEFIGANGAWLGTTRARTAMANLIHLGGTILPFPFIFWTMARRWKGAAAWVGLTGGGIVAAQFADYTWTEKTFLAFCFAGGITAALWIVDRGIRSCCVHGWTTGDVFLCLWALGILTASVAVFSSGSARYLLPALPPLLLLLIRTDEQRSLPFRQLRLFYASLFVVQLLLGVVLAKSDYEFAGAGRRAVRDFEAHYRQGEKPFLFSGEWGFRYYLTAMGGEIMTEDTTGSPGELVIKSRLCLGQTFDNELDRSLNLIERRTYRIRSPIRLLDQHSHAGFWSNGWGVLPFGISSEPLDEISIYRVKNNR